MTEAGSRMGRAALEEALELVEAEGRAAQDEIAALKRRLKVAITTSMAIRKLLEMTPADEQPAAPAEEKNAPEWHEFLGINPATTPDQAGAAAPGTDPDVP